MRHPRYTPMTNNLPAEIFFWNKYWIWGDVWTYITVQMDPVLLFLLPVFIVIGIAQRKEKHFRPVCIFLLVVLGAMAWLQTRYAFWVYENVPGAIYLQFTYRLLAYETVILVICTSLTLGYALDRLKGLSISSKPVIRPALIVVALALVWVTASPKLGRDSIRYEWIPPQRVQDDLKHDYLAMGEFFPLVDWVPLDDIQAVLRQTLDFAAISGLKPCDIVETDTGEPRERSSGRWRINCPVRSSVSLSVFAAPGMEVRTRSAHAANWTTVPVNRTCSDPRLRVDLQKGSNAVEVRFPNWWRTVKTIIQRPAFDFRRDCTLPPAARYIAGHRAVAPPP